MYNGYFNFKEAPFSIAPDPRYLYMTEQHRDALAHLVYGLNSEGGCILLTGEVGTGKTTICRCLLEQIPELTNIALVVNPKVTAVELLETICDELKIEYPAKNNTVKTYIDQINRFLIEANARNEKNVLIIDEAQNLDDTVLEQLRLLTNLETNQRKLLQIIILGQPELLDILSRKEMRQLAQRITARFHLNALSRDEVKAYINHRLAVAGQNARLFPDTTISKLYRLSHGIPRLVNVICDRALLGTYVQNKPVVDKKTLSTAAKEVFGELKHTHEKSKTEKIIYAGIIIAITVALIFILFNNKAVEVTATDTAIVAPALPVINTIEESSVTEKITPKDLQSTNKQSPKADTSTNPLTDYFLTSNNNSQEIAFNALLQLWRPNYLNQTNTSVCKDINHGLSCLQQSGNLNSLRKLNRPVILKLYDNAGKNYHIVLSHLDNNLATLYTGQNSFKVDTTLLEKQWYGEFLLLWQPPPFYQKAISPNTQGPIVQWLGQQLARLDGNSNNVPTIHNTYSEELVTQVKNFQQSKGLSPDGIAGPLTLIHLNTETDTSVPVLHNDSKVNR